MIRRTLFFALVATVAVSCGGKQPAAQTDPAYCNPMDLDYGWGAFKQTLSRASADPVIVLFKDRYYLFSTHDTGGYRVSDDLVTWRDIAFCPAIRPAALNDGRYVAPAVATDGEYIYFIKLNRVRTDKTTAVIRTADPDSGVWEECGQVRRVEDPTLFIDEGRFFIYHGLGAKQSIRCFEVDPATFAEIPDSERLLLPIIEDVKECQAGYHFGRRELTDEIDGREWTGRFNYMPCPEGSWIVRHGDKYYLQFATPGTIGIWYCDVVMVSDSPTGPFEIAPYNPVSMKVGGFIGSAGHSCVFQDRYDNWWEVTTMWVGNADPFERRLGLFPVSFDGEGRMRVHTLFGDYPMRVPLRKFDPATESLAGWNLLSRGKACTASSSLEGHDPALGGDENIRTWWSAASGDAGEWFAMDLGAEMRIDALQLHFAEQDCDTTLVSAGQDYTAYKIYVSNNGRRWRKLIDQSANTTTNPHPYFQLDESVHARHVKVVCDKAMLAGRFAIRDLRLFGSAEGSAPEQVTQAAAVRNRQDERFAMATWSRVGNADGYIVRFGYDPGFLNLAVQVKGNDTNSLQLHILTKGVPYYYCIDSYNESGVTPGKVFAEE